MAAMDASTNESRSARSSTGYPVSIISGNSTRSAPRADARRVHSMIVCAFPARSPTVEFTWASAILSFGTLPSLGVVAANARAAAAAAARTCADALAGLVGPTSLGLRQEGASPDTEVGVVVEQERRAHHHLAASLAVDGVDDHARGPRAGHRAVNAGGGGHRGVGELPQPGVGDGRGGRVVQHRADLDLVEDRRLSLADG